MKSNYHSEVWRLTWPNVLSNISVPLLGMADIAIAGRLGGDSVIGGVSVATTIFNFIYMNCAFLRMGTTGLVAQAFGRSDFRDSWCILLRGLFVAFFLSLLILSAWSPLSQFSVDVMGGTPEVRSLVSRYLSVRVWALPATISLMVFNGWFIGMQDARTPMFMAVVANVINVSVSYLASISLSMGIEGIALGTVVAQYISLLAMSWLCLRRRSSSLPLFVPFASLVGGMGRFLQVSRDVLLRNVCIVSVFTVFTRVSASLGDAVLATNTILMQFFTLYSYFSDGVAFAAESLSGRLTGQGNSAEWRAACRQLVCWGMAVALLFILFYALAWNGLLSLFDASEHVVSMARNSLYYVLAVLLVGWLAFILDGIMLGATRVRVLRNAMFCSMVVFFLALYGFVPRLGNDGLWLSFVVFMTVRACFIYIFYKIEKSVLH